MARAMGEKSMTTTRWWENYLVRYLMPSIAGMAAVNWLAHLAGTDFTNILGLDSGPPLDAPGLTLLFLYGNLFCYISSYPILVFHVTRVTDFNGEEVHWNRSFTDGYLSSVALGGVVLAVSFVCSDQVRCALAFILCVVFSTIQLVRLIDATKERRGLRGLISVQERVSPVYALAYSLAVRRGVREDLETSRESARGASEEGKTQRRRKTQWHAELVDTYRHMREHGNSAFIFLLELVLAGLVFCVVSYVKMPTNAKFAAIGVIFAIWALPSVFVHLLGQHIERRFSQLETRWKA